MATKTAQDLARDVLAQFETFERDGRTLFKLANSQHGTWMQDLCREAHDGLLPDDWKYSFIRSALLMLADDENDASDLEPDIYISELTDWLGSNSTRLVYCDEALEEYGGDFKGTFQLLQIGQAREMREVFESVKYQLFEREHELAEPDGDELWHDLPDDEAVS